MTAYRRAASRKNDVERQTEGKDKTGVFTGGWAINPVTGTPHPGVRRRLRADGLRHRRDHGRARPGRARLGLRHGVRPADHPHRAADRGPRRAHRLHRRGPGDQQQQRRAQPRRAGRRRGQGSASPPGSRRTASARRRSPTSCATGCSAGSATGASRSRSSSTRTASPTRVPDVDAARRAARRPRLQPEDLRPRGREQRARAAAVARRRVGGRRARPRRRPRHPPLPPRDEHDAQLGRVVLVLPALPRPGQRRGARRPRERGLLDGAAPRAGRRCPRGHARPGRRRPLRRRRRARRAAPALRALLAQGARTTWAT